MASNRVEPLDPELILIVAVVLALVVLLIDLIGVDPLRPDGDVPAAPDVEIALVTANYGFEADLVRG